MRFDKQDIRLLNLYDFGARMFSPFNMRWMTIDPLAEKYYHISPYVYCAGGPVNIVDPDGRHLVVTRNENNQYIICCGQMNDDLNIYEFYLNDSMEWESQTIGLMATKTSFFNSDTGEWAVGSIINPNDNSGKEFLEKMKAVTLVDYIDKARGDHEYDFKVTNGTDNVISKRKGYINRGMPIGESENGLTVYASARDVGNMAAGYVAGLNGLSWSAIRFGADLYQSYQASFKEHRIRLNGEGMTTTNAQFYGWRMSGRDTWNKGLPR